MRDVIRFGRKTSYALAVPISVKVDKGSIAPFYLDKSSLSLMDSTARGICRVLQNKSISSDWK